MSDVQSRHRWFTYLDRAFWMVWLALPLVIFVSLKTLVDPGRLATQLPPELARCADLAPDPARMSAAGTAMYWGLFVFQVSIYLVLLGFLHVMVHRFATGRIFVGETLGTLQKLGVILIVWPFLETGVTNAVAYVLKARGDLPLFLPGYAIDIGPIAVGLFLLALRYALEQAIDIKSENDLTI